VLADTLHFGQAAQLLHISQPGLSAEIKRFETQLGVTLFRRSPRTALTHEGEALLTEASAVLAGAERFASASSALATGSAGVVTIGSTATVLEDGLLEAVAGLRTDAPDLQVLVEEMSTAEAVAALRTGRVDLALGNAAGDAPELTSTRLASAPFALAVPSGAGPAPAPEIPPGLPARLDACARAPFAVFRRSASPRFHDTVRALCTEAGFEPRFTYRSRTWRSTLDAVSAGICVALAPEPIARARAAADPRVALALVLDSHLTAESWISRRADASSVVLDRVEHAVVRALGATGTPR
jgi:DNA-binding transcriptional LysR family regulator